MADFGFTPNLIASADILPFRFVKVSGAFTGAKCDAGTDIPVGVTDGSVANFANTQSGFLHASSGLPISLQPSNTVQVEIGTGGVSAGDFLMPDANGRAVLLATAGNYGTYQALEAGAAGEVIRAFRTGTKKV
jgi:hypothetical protein